MTTTELSQVVNFISKTSEYQNERVGFTVSRSNINEHGFKVHLFEIKKMANFLSHLVLLKPLAY